MFNKFDLPYPLITNKKETEKIAIVGECIGGRIPDPSQRGMGTLSAGRVCFPTMSLLVDLNH